MLFQLLPQHLHTVCACLKLPCFEISRGEGEEGKGRDIHRGGHNNYVSVNEPDFEQEKFL